MKKTGKAGLGHLKKMEKKSRQMIIGRAVLQAATDKKKMERKPCGHCA